MEASTVARGGPIPSTSPPRLRHGAIGYLSNLVIGVASIDPDCGTRSLDPVRRAGSMRTRIMRAPSWIAPAAVWTAVLLGCGAGIGSNAAGASTANAAGTTRSMADQRTKAHPPRFPPYPLFLEAATSTAVSGFVPAVSWQGKTAVRIARTAGGVVVLAFDQRVVELHLHAGTVDPGGTGWLNGPSIVGYEARHLVAAFNGGFKLDTNSGGFELDGRTGRRLSIGLGSIVTYSDGRTDIGSWHVEVPSQGLKVVSVRQNLRLLIDHGVAAPNVDCLLCWGATLGGVSAPARSALGVTANGTLMWAGGEHLTPAGLASALLSAHVVRAVENDINPEWVASYFYGHRGGHGPLAPVGLVPGQSGIPGEFLTPWSRDFFSIVAR
jgi:hypothetical protein